MEKRDQLWKSLRRIEGQVGGIGKMIRDGKECGDILMQISAATSALRSVGTAILAEEAKKCGGSEELGKNYAKLLKRFL